MSETKDETMKKLEELAKFEARKKELQAKELTLKERRVENDLNRLNKNDHDLEVAQKTNFGGMTQEQIEHTQRESEEYIEAARECMVFINDSFEGAVPYFRKNLIFIGAPTGDGKSTTVANVVSSTMRQTNPKTGKRRRVLVITNEEKSEDVYNRVTCLAKGWHYTNHNKFTDEQSETFSKYIPLLAKDGWLTVVDDAFGSTPDNPIGGVTTSIEGIETIFESLIRNGEYYDAVLIDYYQKVQFSKNNPRMNEWEVQSQLAGILDKYKNLYPAPIILLGQIARPDRENTIPFKIRIEGRKVILNSCTAALEMMADRENLRTEWVVHKSRFNENVGNSFHTGYKSGRFVKYTSEFQSEINQMKERKEAATFDKKVGLTLPVEEKKVIE